MKKSNEILIKLWFEKADKDLLTVEHEFISSEPVLESICFHCQQAAEKYLKAYLIFLEINFKKTHEIGELITLAENKDNEINSIKSEADTLTDYAVEIRYPDDCRDLKIDDALNAKDTAVKIKNYILEKINF